MKGAPIFKLLLTIPIGRRRTHNTFNMGIGMVIAVSPNRIRCWHRANWADAPIGACRRRGCQVVRIDRLVVMVSGGGTPQAVLDACAEGRIPARVVGVISSARRLRLNAQAVRRPRWYFAEGFRGPDCA